MIRFLFELIITLVGSAVVWLAVGTPIYALVAVMMALLVLGLALTARARASTSGGYDLIIEPDSTPFGIRVLIAIAAPTLIGLFWPILPTVIAWKRSSNSRIRAVSDDELEDSERL